MSVYLKIENIENIKEQYELLSTLMPENGYENECYGIDFESYKNKILPKRINYQKGIDLPSNYVPYGYYFLYDNQNIIGIFSLRYSLNETLKNGAGHIGYSILKEYRNKHYATKGLALAIKEISKIIKEDEIYLSVNKDNPSSLKVQINNGAYIHHEDDKCYYTRINIK